ncbi:MAG: hypothetical protein WCW35_07890 [Bacteroidota bacterium]|jgi:hypothetical protein
MKKLFDKKTFGECPKGREFPYKNTKIRKGRQEKPFHPNSQVIHIRKEIIFGIKGYFYRFFRTVDNFGIKVPIYMQLQEVIEFFALSKGIKVFYCFLGNGMILDKRALV